MFYCSLIPFDPAYFVSGMPVFTKAPGFISTLFFVNNIKRLQCRLNKQKNKLLNAVKSSDIFLCISLVQTFYNHYLSNQ